MQLNQFRKTEQLNIFNEAKTQVGDEDVIVVKSNTWNEGIIGIVAAKLCETYKKPSFVFTQNQDILKGSCRNNNEINLYKLITLAKDYVIGYGGHKGAAGLSIKMQDFEKFKKHINQVYKQFDDSLKRFDENIFCEIDLNLVDKDLYELIDSFRPYGLNNPMPIFLLTNLQVVNIELIGKNKEYKKLVVAQGDIIKELLVFNQYEFKVGEKINITAYINKNSFKEDISYYLNLKEKL